MTDRKPVSERVKAFESPEGSGSPTTPSAHQLSGKANARRSGSGSSIGEKKKEESSARQRRKVKQTTSVESTSDKPKSADRSDYANTANQGLKASFGIQGSQSGQHSLTSSLTSPTNTKSPSQTESLSFHFDPESHSKVSPKINKPFTSPQPSPPENMPTGEGVTGGHVPVPPSSLRPSTIASRHIHKPPKGDEAKGKVPPPLRAVHDSRMRKDDSEEVETLSPHSIHSHYSHDSLPPSPPCSDGIPSGITQSGDWGKPCQADSLEGPTKILTTDHKSMNVDPKTGKSPDSSQNISRQMLRMASTGSDSSDRVIGPDGSMSLGLLTGSRPGLLVQGLRNEIEDLKKQLEDKNREIHFLTEKSVDKEADELSTQTAPDDIDTLTIENFPSGFEEKEEGGAIKLVSIRTSVKTDDKGNVIPTGARRSSQQEIHLFKQLKDLKAQLAQKETEITLLQGENTRRDGTIKELEGTIQQNKSVYRRGFSNTDIDGYLDKITGLTAQLSLLEEKERASQLANIQLKQKLSAYTDLHNLIKTVSSERNQLRLQVKALSTKLEEEKARHSATSDQTLFSPVEDRMDTRLLSIEARKVPQLQKEVEELKKKVKDAEGYEEMAKNCQDQIIEQVTEVSKKDETIRKLTVNVQELQEEIKSLTLHLQDPPTRTTSDTSLVMNSEAYQILLQESTGKDKQIRQLQSAAQENEQLRMELEVRAQQINSISNETKTELRAKDEEIRRLDKMNTQLREHVVKVTVPMATAGEGKATIETPQKSGQSSKVTDSDKKLMKASHKIAEQETKIKELEKKIGKKNTETEQTYSARILELERQIKEMELRRSSLKESAQIRELKQQIDDLELGQGSMGRELEEANTTIAEMVSDRAGLVEHSKKQSKAILDIKAELQETRQENQQLKATLADRSSDNAKLQETMKKLRHQAVDSSASALQMEAMQTDLDRIRAERNELRHSLQQLREAHDTSKQMVVNQKIIVDNQQKEINDLKHKTVPQLNDSLQRSRAETQQLAQQKKEELELVQQQVQVYLDDFHSERKDREAAHSRIAEMETRYTHQLTAVAEELQAKTKELDIALQANKEMTASRRQIESELDHVKRQLHEYAGHTQKLQEEVQSKTQQVKQYKKQVDQFRDQVEAGQDQAAIHKAQVESAVSQSDELKQENQLLRHEIQNLNGRLRHLDATSSNQQQNQQLQAQLAQHLETINQLTLDKTLLQSELEQFKKEKGVAATPAPPARPSNPIRHQSGNRPPLLPNQGAMRPPSQPPPPSQGLQPNRQHLNPQWKAQSVDDSRLGSRSQRQAHTGQLGSSQLSAGDPPRHYQHRTADMGRLPSSSSGYNPPRDNTLHQPSHFPHPASNADQSYPVNNSSSSSGNNQHRSPYPPQHLLAPGYDQHGPSSLPPSIGSPTHGSYGHDRGMYGQREMGGAHYQDDIVDKDSPPSSYQSPGENTSHPSNARSQFVNKRQAFAQSSDSYYQSQTGRGNERPQAVRPLPSPRIQADTDTSRAQHQHHGSGHPPSQTGGRHPHPVNPSFSHHGSRVGHPYQESLGAAATQAPLPAKLKVQGQNIFTPSSQGQPHAGVGGGPRYPHTSTSRREETSASSDYSNQLDKDIDAEIRREAWKVARQGSGEESLPAEGDAIPLDPNLICPHCRKQFRLGEIQKFRKHAASCTK